MTAREEQLRAALHAYFTEWNEEGCVHFDKGFGPYALCEDQDQLVPFRRVLPYLTPHPDTSPAEPWGVGSQFYRRNPDYQGEDIIEPATDTSPSDPKELHFIAVNTPRGLQPEPRWEAADTSPSDAAPRWPILRNGHRIGSALRAADGRWYVGTADLDEHPSFATLAEAAIFIEGRAEDPPAPVAPLDAAWAEAEAALPEGWTLRGLSLDLWAMSRGDTRWFASAGRGIEEDRPYVVEGEPSATAVDALTSLTSALWALDARAAGRTPVEPAP